MDNRKARSPEENFEASKGGKGRRFSRSKSFRIRLQPLCVTKCGLEKSDVVVRINLGLSGPFFQPFGVNTESPVVAKRHEGAVDAFFLPLAQEGDGFMKIFGQLAHIWLVANDVAVTPSHASA